MVYFGFGRCWKSLAMPSLIAMVVASAVATPAAAINIKEAAQRRVEAEASSIKSLYDLERCIIDIDAGTAPNIYSQPDRPNEALIVYSSSGLIYALIQLEKSQTGTALKVRSVNGVGGSRIKSHTLECAA